MTTVGQKKGKKKTSNISNGDKKEKYIKQQRVVKDGKKTQYTEKEKNAG